VDLAKQQLQYRVNDAARYNLRRAGVTSAVQIQRYQIDPGVLVHPPAPDSAKAAEAAPAAAGKAAVAPHHHPAAAIATLEARVQTGDTTSRNHFALAKAYAAQGDTTRARASARLAEARLAQDGQLTDTERCELGELLRDGH
jgi:hypothetical protein